MTRKCWSPPRPSEAISTSSRNGNHDARKNRRAGASNRQDINEAARRRLQPARRSSPRGRPRPTTIVAYAGQFQCCRRAPVGASHRVFPIPLRSACRRARGDQGQASRWPRKARPALTAPALGSREMGGRDGRTPAARSNKRTDLKEVSTHLLVAKNPCPSHPCNHACVAPLPKHTRRPTESSQR